MKIGEVYIENFKSIGKLNFNCSDLNILVGKNNVGKTNLLTALNLFFNTSDKILSNDMFCYFTKGQNIVIELTFDRLTELEKTGRLKKYICNSLEDGIRVRKIVKSDGGRLKSYYHGYVEEPDIEWLQSDFKGYGKQEFWASKGIDFYKYTSVERGRIIKDLFNEFRENYIKENKDDLKFNIRLSETEFEGIKTVGVDMLPQFRLIPAVGDVSDIVAGSSRSLLARVVGEIIRAAAQEEGILKDVQQGLEMAGGLVNKEGQTERLPQIEEIEKWLKDEMIDWDSPDFKITTSFPEIHTLLTQNLRLFVDDGAPGDVSTKGHGFQRQLIFKMIHLSSALLRGEMKWGVVKDAFDKSPPIILAFEEPELYLHPQAQLGFYDDIEKLSSRDQIFLCTHSTHLLALENFEGVKVLRRDSSSKPTKVSECAKDLKGDLDLRRKLVWAKLFDANVNKVFFADKIVIVEGDEDIVSIVRTAKDYGECFSHRVTIVNAGGNSNIPNLQRVLNAFGIPYTVVYDIDPGDESSKEIQQRIEQLVGEGGFGAASIAMDPNLPNVMGMGTDGEVRGKKAAACMRFLDDNEPTKKFLENVKALYDLSSLDSN